MILLVIILALILMILGAPIFIVISGLALYLLSSGQIDSSAMIIEMHRMATTPILFAIPPLGINLFISSIRFDKPVLQLYVASLPFIAILLVGLLIITYFPWLSLVLLK